MRLLRSIGSSDLLLIKRASRLLIAFAAVMVFCGWTAMYFTRLHQPVIVPKVIGMDQKQAERVLKSKGLLMSVGGSQFDDRIPAGSVVLQIPRPNDYRQRRETVQVTVSKGKPRLSVPNVVKQTLRRAQTLLTQAQLRIGHQSFMSSGTVPKDTVLAQVPQAGEPAKSSSAVNLLISTGPVEPTYVMPNLRKEPIEKAFQLFRTAAIMVEKIKTVVQDDLPTGTILGQNPPAGTQIEGGASVTLTVSTTSADSAVQARLAPFDFVMPEGPPRRLRIDVMDNTGTRTIHNKMEETGNEIKLEIKVTGKATAQIYLNQQFDRDIPIE